MGLPANSLRLFQGVVESRCFLGTGVGTGGWQSFRGARTVDALNPKR